MQAVLDVVGFKDTNGEFIVKELAIVSLDRSRVQHFLFKEPKPWSEVETANKKDFLSQTVNNHGLRWEDGQVAYQELEKTFKCVVSGCTALYAYGTEKCDLIHKLTRRTVINLQSDFKAPDAFRNGFKGTQSCFHPCHNNTLYSCAMTSALSLAEWLHYYNSYLQSKCVLSHAAAGDNMAAGICTC